MRTLLIKAPSESNDGDEDPYVAALRSAGLFGELLDVISFDFVNVDVLKEKVGNPESFGGLIFTSPRGVYAVKQCIGDGFNREMWSREPCYAVGEATAKSARIQLGLSCSGDQSGNAELLAEFIYKDNMGKLLKPLLFPSAERGLNILPRILEQNGVPVDKVVVYQTVPHPNLEQNLNEKLCNLDLTGPEVLIFFSPSGVSAVIPLLHKHGFPLSSFKFVAIGPSTEQALKEHDAPVLVTSSKPSPTCLVESIKSTLNIR